MIPTRTAPVALALSTQPTTLRLRPIERPRGLLLRLFNWAVRRRLGKAMTPAKVIYARLPSLLWRTLPMYHLLERGLSLDPELRHLIEVHVASVNGCAFCHDAHLAEAMRYKTSRAKLNALSEPNPSASSAFDARERAALRYVEEIARGGASDEAFAALYACFNEREIVEITWLQAFTTYLLRMAQPLGIGSDGFCALQDPQRPNST